MRNRIKGSQRQEGWEPLTALEEREGSEVPGSAEVLGWA